MALFIVLAVVAGIWIWNSIQFIKVDEVAVVLRLGLLLPNVKRAGIRFAIWPIDVPVRVSLRVQELEIPPQRVSSQDKAEVDVSLRCQFKVEDAFKAISQVQDFRYATSECLRERLISVAGVSTAGLILDCPQEFAEDLMKSVNNDVKTWGVHVIQVEVTAKEVFG